jgi:purine-binding chemotaxis protein CheW
MARPETSREAAASASTSKFVGFTLGKEEYAVDILKVKEIKLMLAITRVPKAPPFVEGVINLRGEIIPIIDLRKKLSLAISPQTEDSRIIVIELDERLVGIIVDSVSEVLELPDDKISPPPPIVAGIEAEYLRGVGRLGDRLLILLDLDKILTVQEKTDLKRV